MTIQTDLQVLMPTAQAIELIHLQGYTGSIAEDIKTFYSMPYFITDGHRVMAFEFVTYSDYLLIENACVATNNIDYYAILADGYGARYDGPKVEWNDPQSYELMTRALEEVVIPEARKANIKGLALDSQLITHNKEWMKMCVDRGIVTNMNGAYGIPFTSDFGAYTLSDDDAVLNRKTDIDEDLPF